MVPDVDKGPSQNVQFGRWPSVGTNRQGRYMLHAVGYCTRVNRTAFTTFARGSALVNPSFIGLSSLLEVGTTACNMYQLCQNIDPLFYVHMDQRGLHSTIQ